MKKLILICAAVIIVLFATVPARADAWEIRIFIDGIHVEFAHPPMFVDEKMFVPARDLFVALGFGISWDGELKQAEFLNETYRIALTIGSDILAINNTYVRVDAPAFLHGTIAMLPLRSVLENIGYRVEWDDAARSASISVPYILTPPEPYTVAETVAGRGSHGGYYSLLSEQLNLPAGIAGLPGGGLLIADTGSNAIKIIDEYGTVSHFAGEIQIAARDNFPMGFYRDQELLLAGFNRPTSIGVNEQGTIFIVDSQNHAIRVITNGAVRTLTGGNGAGFADGNPNAAMFNSPSALSICPNGYLFVADTGNHAIRRVDRYGYVTTVAGVPGYFGFSDGIASYALFDSPMGIVAAYGKVYVADTGNHLIRVIENDTVSTVAGSRVLADEEDELWGQVPIGGYIDAIGTAAMFNFPVGLALWHENIIVADMGNHSVRMIVWNRQVVTIGGTGYPGFMHGIEPIFHLPRGVYIRGNFLYVADTGNNMVRRINLE